MRWKVVSPVALLALVAAEGVALAQQSQPWCVPGTEVCAQSDGKGGVKMGGSAQGQVDHTGASGTAAGNADANANAGAGATGSHGGRSEEHTSELQSQSNLVCRLLLEK